MSRKLLLVSVLSASLAAFGQTGASPDQGNTNANQSSPAQVVVPPATGGTVWTGIGPTGGVLLSTPLATFDSPQPTAGISVAGRAGISNNTPVNAGLESTLAPSTMVYVSSPAATFPAPANENPATEAVSSERMNDFVPSAPITSVGASSVTNNLSLAEVAAMYKARQGTQTLRTYTNADVPRENAGLLTNTIMASNNVPPPPQSASTQSPAPRTSQSQSSSQQQETATQSATTENPQPSQDQAAGENKGLPATSTLLPLLGLLGVASAGIGVWYRRRGR